MSSQEKERARYARDLHDGFGQMISILNMNLQNLEKDAKPDERQKVFEDSSKLIDEMYGELKNICFDLMPQTLIKNGLESALTEFVERINAAGKVFIELNVFGLDDRLQELQEISLYRISQEWINNILKYSDAQKITLQVTRDKEELTLMVEDDGAGFNKDQLVNGTGNGWKNLNTRTNLIHGELELETSLNQKGNTLIVNAPAQLEIHEQNTVVAV
ncbi:MAG: histidine kinase [Bacteroidota bacterium]